MMEQQGRVIWITGLSGAGKSTLAREVATCMRVGGVAVVMLDGDELRELFGVVEVNASNHGREGRLHLAMQYARLCHVIASQGVNVVIATISMFHEIHEWNRENLTGYFEVYLKVPMEELRRRDAKGIYGRYDAGELENVAGLDLPIDEPEAPDCLIEFNSGKSARLDANKIMETLNSKDNVCT